MVKEEYFSWQPGELPEIYSCGIYPMDIWNNGYVYQCHERQILHLYLYEARIKIGGKEFTIKPGDITFTPLGTASQYWLTYDSQHWCSHFYLKERGNTLPFPMHLSTGAAFDRLVEDFKRAAFLFNLAKQGGGSPMAMLQARLLLAQILAQIAELAQSPKPQAAPRMNQSKQALERLHSFIEEHLNEKLSAVRLAREAGLSQNYLARIFREHFGMTLPRYLRLRQLDKAASLLRDSSLPIKNVAAICGLPDAQQFNKEFRRHHSVCPSRYREDFLSADKKLR